MEDFNLVAPDGTDINNQFLKQYRDALRNQYDTNVSSLKQEKRNADASIMSAANEAGMMYSNFPQRSKIQNEASYLKNMSDLHTTYQTGLDKLRGNAVDTFNKIKDLEDAITDLNEYSNKNSSTTNNFANQVATALEGAGKLGDNSDDEVADNLKEQQEKLGITDSNTSGSASSGGVGKVISDAFDWTSDNSLNGHPFSLSAPLGYVLGSPFGALGQGIGMSFGTTADIIKYGRRKGWWN